MPDAFAAGAGGLSGSGPPAQRTTIANVTARIAVEIGHFILPILMISDSTASEMQKDEQHEQRYDHHEYVSFAF